VELARKARGVAVPEEDFESRRLVVAALVVGATEWMRPGGVGAAGGFSIHPWEVLAEFGRSLLTAFVFAAWSSAPGSATGKAPSYALASDLPVIATLGVWRRSAPPVRLGGVKRSGWILASDSM
jgi:hypothetical protein